MTVTRVCQAMAFFGIQILQKFNFGPSFAPDPDGEAYDAPTSPSPLGRGFPLPIPHSLDALRVEAWCFGTEKNRHWSGFLNPISGSAPGG